MILFFHNLLNCLPVDIELSIIDDLDKLEIYTGTIRDLIKDNNEGAIFIKNYLMNNRKVYTVKPENNILSISIR